MNVAEVRFDASGLVPGIVQDAASRRVLMLGYLNAESLRATLDTGLVTFWSRSRNALWQKGETSGNTLHLVEVRADCDGDALLILAEPAGPACHTGAASCFEDHPDQGFAWLEGLWDTIGTRAADRPAGSYTASLIAGGVDATGRKVMEEATEVLLAARDHAAGGDPTRVAEEAADLVYHLLVLLAERGLEPSAAIAVLRDRAR